jgi:hypothetical protein
MHVPSAHTGNKWFTLLVLLQQCLVHITGKALQPAGEWPGISSLADCHALACLAEAYHHVRLIQAALDQRLNSSANRALQLLSAVWSGS